MSLGLIPVTFVHAKLPKFVANFDKTLNKTFWSKMNDFKESKL
jgi:hypothetical protein